MKTVSYYIFLILAVAITACNDFNQERQVKDTTNETDTLQPIAAEPIDTVAINPNASNPPAAIDANPLVINTKNVPPDQLVSFAETLVGTPYLYASTDPKAGFDCSGFITYVFSHFNIQVPRSSIDFTNVGETIDEQFAKRGDIILFTGTNPAERFVGHMGLITKGSPEIEFIHSSSGKAHGVTVTPLNEYYRGRFMKIIRIFNENNR